MFELIAAHAQWFWLFLGGVLLVAELLGASGYLFWAGIAAFLVGLLTLVAPGISGEWQGILFALFTLINAYLWWYWLRKKRQGEKGHAPVLNQRNRQLIGTQATLSEAMHNGSGRLNIADGSWRIEASEDYPAGTRVEVIGLVGITLLVRKADD